MDGRHDEERAEHFTHEKLTQAPVFGNNASTAEFCSVHARARMYTTGSTIPSTLCAFIYIRGTQDLPHRSRAGHQSSQDARVSMNFSSYQPQADLRKAGAVGGRHSGRWLVSIALRPAGARTNIAISRDKVVANSAYKLRARPAVTHARNKP
jgi:hypothetical protein